MPFVDERPLFSDFAQHVEYASLSPKERETYERDLKAHRDLVNQMKYAKDEAEKEGMAKGMAEGIAKGIAKGKAEADAYAIRTMHEFGISAARIAEKYNSTIEDIMKILDNKE